MQKISNKKILQAKKFLADPSKSTRLYRLFRAQSKSDKSVIVGYDRNGFPVVFKIKIGGKERAIKLSGDQNIAKWVSDTIRKEHSLAIRRGLIKPKTYVLHVVDFLVANEYGGVMPLVKSFACDSLIQFLNCKSGGSNPSHLINHEKIAFFLEKHPWVDRSVLDKAYAELKSNLNLLLKKSKIPSFDLVSESNVFVVNALDKEKKLVFGLIDQANPLDFKRLDKRYNSLKK